MKKTLLLAVLFIVSSPPFQNAAYAQTITSITVSCGSLAPFGTNWGLEINSAGTGKVIQQNISTGAKSSAIVNLTASQLQAIADTATAVGFYSLSSLYDSNTDDGAGITIRITTTSQQKEVELKNYCLAAVNRIVKTINSKITSSGIQLYYNSLNEVCP